MLNWIAFVIGVLVGKVRFEQEDEAPAFWAAVEVFGQRRHVGRAREGEYLGEPALFVEVLRRDGGFDKRVYSKRALFGVNWIDEKQARAEALPRWGMPCQVFTQPSARPGACSVCGRDGPEHEARAAEEAEAERLRELVERVREVLDLESDPDFWDNLSLTWDGDGPGQKIQDVRVNGGRISPEQWANLVAAGLPIWDWTSASASWPEAPESSSTIPAPAPAEAMGGVA